MAMAWAAKARPSAKHVEHGGGAGWWSRGVHVGGAMAHLLLLRDGVMSFARSRAFDSSIAWVQLLGHMHGPEVALGAAPRCFLSFRFREVSWEISWELLVLAEQRHEAARAQAAQGLDTSQGWHALGSYVFRDLGNGAMWTFKNFRNNRKTNK